ncbi:membrane hypothetical protein [Thermococcus barophilus]|uniref:Uncharacterized protein n=2 Tax=Thermococcus barophilus TaxID=55802 RepID=A0A0S1XCN6_THEBA|nr:membrane hypothetical protein [Thermococcus barophilus]
MARSIRVISAFVLFVLLINYPIVTISYDYSDVLSNTKVGLTYPILTLIALNTMVADIATNYNLYNRDTREMVLKISEEVAQIKENAENNAQIVLGVLNFSLFVVLLVLALFIAPTIGVFMSFFTRWGFVMVALGVALVSMFIYGGFDTDGFSIAFTPYFYAIWGAIALGIIAGGKGKKESSK